LEGPWTDGAEGSAEGGETDLVAMMRATMGEIEAEQAEVDEVRRRQQVSVRKRPETYDEAYEVRGGPVYESPYGYRVNCYT
jgi:hypothetical protein